MNVNLFFGVHVIAYMISYAQSLDRGYHLQEVEPWPEVNWFIPLHRNLRRVCGYDINFNL